MKTRLALLLAFAIGLCGCAGFRGLQLDLTVTSGPGLKLIGAINADPLTNAAPVSR